jgi:SAM-dependent methyltransferase
MATGGVEGSWGMADPPRSRWTDRADVPRGADYDKRFEDLAASGADVHGEAALVAELAPGRAVLDAGCGTGRVTIELARRGFDVTGLDIDAAMLDAARAKAPDLTWIEGDLAGADLGTRFDAVVLAGNVLIFVAPGTEPAVVARCADHLRPGGLVIAGFQVRPGGYDPTQLDHDAAAAGLDLVDRWSTWDRAPWSPTDRYQVSVHRLR